MCWLVVVSLGRFLRFFAIHLHHVRLLPFGPLLVFHHFLDTLYIVVIFYVRFTDTLLSSSCFDPWLLLLYPDVAGACY